MYQLPDWFSDRIPSFSKHLGHLRDTPVSCIEIGVAEGRCTTWLVENILTHPDSKITCIDPWVMKPDAEIVFDATIGRSSKVTKLKSQSADALLGINEPVDFVYIDGNHEARYVLEDAVLSFRLVKPGGIIAFDDYHWDAFCFYKQTPLPDDKLRPPKQAIDAFLEMWEHCIDVLEVDAQVWIRKR